MIGQGKLAGLVIFAGILAGAYVSEAAGALGGRGAQRLGG
jgi:hypothetical protein